MSKCDHIGINTILEKRVPGCVFVETKYTVSSRHDILMRINEVCVIFDTPISTHILSAGSIRRRSIGKQFNRMKMECWVDWNTWMKWISAKARNS